MWVSSSAFEQLLDSSKCSVVHLSQRLDPQGEYIKRYIPELKKFPQRFIHEPWKAPLQIQEEFKVIVGKDYPSPMFDLTRMTQINCQRMKNIRESIIESKPHVRPSNEEEIRNFFWIADDISVKCY
jgi:cryptochrome